MISCVLSILLLPATRAVVNVSISCQSGRRISNLSIMSCATVQRCPRIVPCGTPWFVYNDAFEFSSLKTVQ